MRSGGPSPPSRPSATATSSPTSAPGRVTGVILMLTGVALIPTLTSVVVAALVAQRNREARDEEMRDLELILKRLDEIEQRWQTR